MKKETIFKHEMDESSQAKATLNCLNNRNKKHLKESIGEVYPDSRWGEKERLNGPNGMSKSERDILIKLEQIMPNLVQKAMSKTADHDNPEEIKKLVLNMIMQGNLMQKLGDKVGASWKEFSMGFKSEIINLVKNEFAKHEEQEESFDDTEDFISNVVNLMEDEGLINNNQWDAAYYTVEEMVQSNPNLLQYPSYMQFLNVFGDDILSKLNNQEQEEFTSEQERHDIALATTYCLGESFIDNDGDLDDIYYAVLKVFDSTHDAPATTDYKDVLQWCRKHYKQIESMIN